MRRGEGRGRRGAAGGSNGRSAVEGRHRGSQRLAPRQGNGPFTGELAERTTSGVALALAHGMRVTGRAVPDGAQAILESGLLVRGVRGVGESARRQQDLQSYCQSEKHSRDRAAFHPFTSAHPDRHELRCVRPLRTTHTLLSSELFCKVHVSLINSRTASVRRRPSPNLTLQRPSSAGGVSGRRLAALARGALPANPVALDPSVEAFHDPSPGNPLSAATCGAQTRPLCALPS